MQPRNSIICTQTDQDSSTCRTAKQCISTQLLRSRSTQEPRKLLWFWWGRWWLHHQWQFWWIFFWGELSDKRKRQFWWGTWFWNAQLHAVLLGKMSFERIGFRGHPNEALGRSEDRNEAAATCLSWHFYTDVLRLNLKYLLMSSFLCPSISQTAQMQLKKCPANDSSTVWP